MSDMLTGWKRRVKPLAIVGTALVFWAVFATVIRADDSSAVARYRNQVAPVLTEYCSTCHAAGVSEGNVSFDQFKSDQEIVGSRELWGKVLKQLRAGLMPPQDQPRPTAEQIRGIETWIKSAAFQIDPANPDPGRVTVRRLNRTEYRNTIRDLIGVNYNTDAEFPADDTGHGFDNIGDVLTISPLLLEKYIQAAESIIKQAVPTIGRSAPEITVEGKIFRRVKDGETGPVPQGRKPGSDLYLPYYEPAVVKSEMKIAHPGQYVVGVNVSAHEKFVEGVFDYNKCQLKFSLDGEELLSREFVRQEGKSFHFDFDRQFTAGQHELKFELIPLTPDEPRHRSLSLRVISVTARGPMDAMEHWSRPRNYEKFFPKEVPTDVVDRRQYARELLERFATRAFRRPVDGETVERLVQLAELASSGEGQTFEGGVARAMTAVLASPRFLFREEGTEPSTEGRHPYVDEYALASRLSYFLWSTMPDDELFRLAGEHKLRENLAAQVQRLLGDGRAKEFMRNFVGQWLQTRDIDTVNINSFVVVSRDEQQDPEREQQMTRFRELRNKPFETLTQEEKAEVDAFRAKFAAGRKRFQQFELTGDLRRAMREETELMVAHLIKDDRSLTELLDADYTFLNERLAKHYGIPDVKGNDMRLVKLPADSPRGGILTQATILAITSNPDRTSPVKRGLFILDNVLGVPPPPPPPDVPSLEESAKKIEGRSPTLREQLELHRSLPLCHSCHNRLDPLGLAFENFNALGMFRETRSDRVIDTTGKLLTGEAFNTVQELKRILATSRRLDFYRCVTEKLLTYALGRGLEDYDVEAIDAIVTRLDEHQGRPSVLISGVIESVPFQKCRSAESRSKP
ncbi:MAG: DUF1592 domain-containing protein [Planctomycetes bacterium]|nr:DUF1592 domain-containing protein [Planctomycetota bacterium]